MGVQVSAEERITIADSTWSPASGPCNPSANDLPKGVFPFSECNVSGPLTLPVVGVGAVGSLQRALFQGLIEEWSTRSGGMSGSQDGYG